jgi:hypothetical protein
MRFKSVFLILAFYVVLLAFAVMLAQSFKFALSVAQLDALQLECFENAAENVLENAAESWIFQDAGDDFLLRLQACENVLRSAWQDIFRWWSP